MEESARNGDTAQTNTKRKHLRASSVSDLDPEKVLTALGKYGKYQVYFLLLLPN